MRTHMSAVHLSTISVESAAAARLRSVQAKTRRLKLAMLLKDRRLACCYSLTLMGEGGHLQLKTVRTPQWDFLIKTSSTVFFTIVDVF